MAGSWHAIAFSREEEIARCGASGGAERGPAALAADISAHRRNRSLKLATTVAEHLHRRNARRSGRHHHDAAKRIRMLHRRLSKYSKDGLKRRRSAFRAIIAGDQKIVIGPISTRSRDEH